MKTEPKEMSDDVWEIFHFVGEGRYELNQVINWNKTKNWNNLPCPSKYFENFSLKELECMKIITDSIYNFINERFYVKSVLMNGMSLFEPEEK